MILSRPATILAAAALAVAATPCAHGETGPVKVFLLAGQSNMEGQGVVSMDHPQYYNGGKGNLAWSMVRA